MPASQAAFLAGAMRRVVTEGTARHAMAGEQIEIAGKTGTAQLGEGMPHAWFTGFAPYDADAAHRLAFAVLVEHGGYGARAAAPVAREVMEAACGAARSWLRPAILPSPTGDARNLGQPQSEAITNERRQISWKNWAAPYSKPRSPPAPKQDEPPELAEIRLAVLDHIREKSYRSGGKKVFPFDLLRVEMRGVEESRRDVFAGRFFRQYLEQEVRGALRDGGLPLPRESPRGCRTAGRIAAAGRSLAGRRDRRRRSARTPAPSPSANWSCAKARPTPLEIRLDKARTNIGRVVDVYRAEGLFRRNDLAFEADTEINRSVSREHAHIRYDRAAGEYRLFNDRWYARGAERRLRHLDRPRRHEPGSASHRAGNEAGTGRRDSVWAGGGDV